jgi:hypothetical protein
MNGSAYEVGRRDGLASPNLDVGDMYIKGKIVCA